ncbi:MAG: hypothetical protein GYA51_00430 [Candidatus Methanofastidiosa archaeon]|nr:hypothetical protein [Candidatus Methanofastidiosa archaeon]
MEHPQAIEKHHGLYPYHAGAPDDENYQKACDEIIGRFNDLSASVGISPISITDLKATQVEDKLYNALGEPVSQTSTLADRLKESAEYVVEGFGEALVSLSKEFPHLVVLDADLSSDCRLRKFENTFPERFIECGISEQNMVSVAGGLARMGLLPVVNSFASFLASRANEQIYNNATEKTHIIYVFHYGGLIPAGPGKSHQSVRDISLVGALPEVTIIQPSNPLETYEALRYFIVSGKNTNILRLNIGPSPSHISLPDNYKLIEGNGVRLKDGQEIAIVAYGPVMLHEALKASDFLSQKGISARVYNMPWLNTLDIEWFLSEFEHVSQIFILEDHATFGGLGHFWLKILNDKNLLGLFRIHIFGIEGYPTCGTPAEALIFHGLEGQTLARRIIHHLDKSLKNYGYTYK